MSENPIFERIRDDLENNDVVLYMKGNASFPQCGFSATVARILDRLGLEYKDVNILLDDELREALCEFSNWPTTPKLYVKGEFVGGCDIVREMFEEGELQALLKEKNITFQEAA